MGAAVASGTEYAPPPEGFVGKLGTCIGADATRKGRCEYSIGIVEDDAHVPKVAYGARLLGHDRSMRAKWEVLGRFDIPPLAEGYTLSYGSCSVDGIEDSTVIAAVRYVAGRQWLGEALWAKRFVISSGTWSDVEPGSVRCINEGFGGDT